MTGGDRMLDHAYASAYASHLERFIDGRHSRVGVVMEIGILRGTGLAIWKDLFPQADVIGLDIDLEHARGNLSHLKDLGAFVEAEPELYEFDQFTGGADEIDAILQGRRVNIMIDDGFHSLETIFKSFHALRPHLASSCCCFIEDCAVAGDLFVREETDFTVSRYEELTILERG